MLKFALMNLWNRRGRYGWLFVELIIVSLLSWLVLDRLVVLTYQYNRPLGYDADLLVTMQLEDIGRRDRDYVPGRTEEDEVNDFYDLLGYVRSLPEVDKATPCADWGLEIGSAMNVGMSTPDGGWIHYVIIQYVPGQQYFSTYGMKGDGGADNADYLSDIPGPGIMMTRRLAGFRFPGQDPFEACDSMIENAGVPTSPSQVPNRLLALVGEFRPTSTEPGSFGFEFQALPAGVRTDRIVMRLHPDVDCENFVTQLLGRIGEFRRGNIRAVMVRSYRSMIEEGQNRESGPNRRLDRIFAVFFLLNVCLGVTGTFWMMTRKRSPEVGVMRAFGYTPGRVRMLLFLEVTVLSVVSWVIGCGFYLIYALKNGLFVGKTDDFTHTWVESFPQHFAVISGIILILLMISVLIGVIGPGWRLSRVNPVVALRDE